MHRSRSTAWKRGLEVSAAAVIIGLVSTGCVTTDPRGDDWFGRDKAWHFAVGGAISAGTVAAARRNDVPDAESMVWGVGVTMTMGAGKELYDVHVRKSYWSWRDMTWNLAGSLLGGLIVLSAE